MREVALIWVPTERLEDNDIRKTINPNYGEDFNIRTSEGFLRRYFFIQKISSLRVISTLVESYENRINSSGEALRDFESRALGLSAKNRLFK
jgi:hypothetical protein